MKVQLIKINPDLASLRDVTLFNIYDVRSSGQPNNEAQHRGIAYLINDNKANPIVVYSDEVTILKATKMETTADGYMTELDQILDGYIHHRQQGTEPDTLRMVFDLSWDEIRTLEQLYRRSIEIAMETAHFKRNNIKVRQSQQKH